jgi:hypothetical protein
VILRLATIHVLEAMIGNIADLIPDMNIRRIRTASRTWSFRIVYHLQSENSGSRLRTKLLPMRVVSLQPVTQQTYGISLQA